jgi:MYXO-CTERM domain-containing protein
MSFRLLGRTLLMGVGIGAATAVVATPNTARACGGFFCSSATLPVNQAAEKIIFSKNADGTVTAVIEILYQGPAPAFSWLLPIASVPKPEQIGLASKLAFTRLQSATNPQYSLSTRVDGTCKESGFPGSNSVGTGGSAGSSAGGFAVPARDSNEGVTVDASGTIGAFDYKVISVDETVTDPSDVAVKWLTDNGYTVGEGAPGLLRPYLQDGMHLLALRLIKGADVGSIRPLMLTYDGKSPMIPIKLTAVAANDDMGVMTWLLADARGVPQNYLSLELNDARLDWFNNASNYAKVVTAAADEAEGHGFVTEFAGKTAALANVVWTPSDDAQWSQIQRNVYASFDNMFNSIYAQYGQFDGFWDAVRASVTLPADVKFADFQSCPNCYTQRVQFAPSALFAALESNVIKPMKDVQALFDRSAYVTRLYSTMSAKEMTADPLFTFNPDLQDVSNVHTAVRVIECNPKIQQFEAPWRVELPSGQTVRGTADQVGTWPAAFDSQEANTKIVQMSASGPGVVLLDNSPAIGGALDQYNAKVPGGAVPSGSSCSTSTSSKRDAGWLLAAMAALIWSGRRRRG